MSELLNDLTREDLEVFADMLKVSAKNYGRHLSESLPDNPTEKDLVASVDRAVEEWGMAYLDEVEKGVNEARRERGLPEV